MRMRPALALLPAVLMAGAVSATAVAQDAAPIAGEVWAGHAAPDGAVAREGRAAMPFTTDQIEALGRLLRETQDAIARAADVPPEGRIRRVRIGAPGDGAIPAIAVRKGYVTAVTFADATGAPWPIEEVLVDGRFVPEAVLPEADGSASGGKAGHVLYLAPQARALHGNAVVKLRGLAEPLALILRGGGATADFRVEVRLGLHGPNAGSRSACGRGLPCRRSGAAGPAGRHRAAGGGASGDRGRRPGRPGLAPRRRAPSGDRRASSFPRSLGGGAQRRRTLGLPPAGHPLRDRDP